MVVSVCESEKYFSTIPAVSLVPVISSEVRRVRVTETAIVHNAFKLPHRFEKLCNRFPVPYLFGDKETPAKGGEVTLHPAAFLCGFRQEQIAGMVQERSFIEMPFKGTGKETQIILLDVRRIVLFDEPVLFVYDAVIGQHLYRLVPSGMYRFVFGCRDGKQFGCSTRNATVMSASLETMQPFSTVNSGNLFSSVVAFNIFLISMFVSDF